MNAKTVTSLTFAFNLPRDLYENEEILYRLGIDLESSNLGNERMLLSVYDSSDNKLDVTNVWTDNILSLTWDPTYTYFQKGQYKIKINGLITPTTHKNGVMQIFFKRTYDQAIVLASKDSSIPTNYIFREFPLKEFQIKGTEYFTEGLLGSLTFGIKTTQSIIDPLTKIYFFFPTIFSPTLTNQPELLTCKINSVKIPCETSM